MKKKKRKEKKARLLLSARSASLAVLRACTMQSLRSSASCPALGQHSAQQLIALIPALSCHYAVLGVHRSASPDQLRRAYLQRSRLCHPDKHPDNPQATLAFQKLSTAYATLRQPSSRHAYDCFGQHPASGSGSDSADDTLYGVLIHMWFEFVDGNFDSLMNVAGALVSAAPPPLLHA